MASTERAPERRLHSLDALRGLAAMGVAFCWHYVHFKPSFSAHRQEMPFFNAFRWLYDYGFTLVDFFFVLSGFIFLRTYGDRIAQGRVSFQHFLIYRLSRLYPLHLLTLLVVCAELLWVAGHPGPFKYDNNNAFFLVLNLLMVQSGWFGGDQSFNGPAWSVATEVIVYLVFFAVVANLRNRLRTRLAFIACVYIGLGLLLRHGEDYLILNSFTERALLGFFIGCLLSDVTEWLERQPAIALAVQVAFVFAAIALVLATRKFGFERVLFHYDLMLPLTVYPGVIVFVLLNRPAATVLSLPPFRVLGEASFSMYLWHFPLQTLLSIAFINAGIAPERPLAWCLYAGTVIVVGVASHRLFEQPMQNLIRRRLVTGSAPASAPALAPMGS